jgi:hypothetical protein
MKKQVLNPSIGEKTVILFLITPAIPASIFSAYSLIEYQIGSMLVLGIIFVGVYLIASAHGFLLGIPAFLLFKRLNTIHWWTCILVAFLIGGLPIGLWRGWSESVAWGLLGASGGFGFWLLWQFWIHSDQQQRLG